MLRYDTLPPPREEPFADPGCGGAHKRYQLSGCPRSSKGSFMDAGLLAYVLGYMLTCLHVFTCVDMCFRTLHVYIFCMFSYILPLIRAYFSWITCIHASMHTCIQSYMRACMHVYLHMVFLFTHLHCMLYFAYMLIVYFYVISCLCIDVFYIDFNVCMHTMICIYVLTSLMFVYSKMMK